MRPKSSSNEYPQSVSLVLTPDSDYLDEDLRSGYVRVLQEIIAAGYSDEKLAQAARELLGGWFKLLRDLAEEAKGVVGGWGELSDDEVACLVGLVFLGAESMLLIGIDLPIRSALRAIGRTLVLIEQRTGS